MTLICHLQAQRAFKKMPILSQLSRRFHDMLTTDAKADPPRTGSYTHNLPPTPDEELTKTQSKSVPVTLENEQDDVSMQRQKSMPNDKTSTIPTDFCTKPEDLGDTRSTSESKEYKRPRTKTKPKFNKCCKLFQERYRSRKKRCNFQHEASSEILFRIRVLFTALHNFYLKHFSLLRVIPEFITAEKRNIFANECFFFLQNRKQTSNMDVIKKKIMIPTQRIFENLSI